MKIVNKPPIGAIPRKIWESQCIQKRYSELCRAISEYYNAGEEILPEWIEEYNELIPQIKKLEDKNIDVLKIKSNKLIEVTPIKYNGIMYIDKDDNQYFPGELEFNINKI